MRTFAWATIVAATLSLCISSCDDDDGGLQCPEEEEGEEHGDEGPIGTPSGATCPTDNAPTYESFGRDFMTKYCTRCHSSELMGDDRMCAPLYHDFDTLEGVLVVADHIDQYAAAGPDSTNTRMPENGPTPTLEERQTLGQWLRCELDKM